MVSQAPRHSGTGPGGGAVRPWGHSTGSGPNPGRLEKPQSVASAWLWYQLVNPDSSARGVPFPLPGGLPHSHALLFLLCDYVTSRGCWTREAQHGFMLVPQGWGSRAGLSALRAERQGHHEPPRPAESSWAQGPVSRGQGSRGPAEVQASALRGLELVGNALLETWPAFPSGAGAEGLPMGPRIPN